MSRPRLLISLFILALFAVSATAADNTAPRPFAPVQDGFVPEAEVTLPYAADRLLVQFSPEAMARMVVPQEKGAVIDGAGTGLTSFDLLVEEAGVRRIERPYHLGKNMAKATAFGVDRWLMFHFDKVDDLPALAESLREDKNVDAVSLDWVAYPAAVPGDPMYPDHWGHNNTAQLHDLDWGGTYEHTLPNTVGTVGFDANAEAAWDASQGYGSSSVIIAILDSGVEAGHPDLRQVAGYDFGDNDSNPDDNSSDPGHGTACAGVAASMNNNLGSVGIAAGASIMPCKVADSSGSMYFSYIQDALYWAADHGADVISMSFGASISSDSATDTALLYAYNAGVTLLAATGNENASTISYPAINQYVIGVGAASPCGERKRSSSNWTEVNSGVNTDPNGYTCDGERWWGSNYGSTTQDDRGAVDIIAPTILPTTDLLGSAGYDSGDYSGYFNGTSCATPYAAGVCALIKSANPSWTPSQVRQQLVDTAQDITSVESGAGWDRYTGYGMVDAAAAVGGGGGPVAPTADFTGTPTSGEYPLAVAFTDLSSGGPDSWSWTFGDGGTSTAQNPSHTYTAAGTYTVTLSVSNTAGDDSRTRTDYITVTEPGTGSWVTITYDDFEGGFGHYTDGGGDCYLYTGGTYAHQGSNAGGIQDNSGTASSFYHTAGYDVSGYSDLEVDFWFYAHSMDNTREDFWVQYFDGSTWQTVATYARTTDFDNDVFYHKVVSIPAGTYNYPANAKLRFMCDASGNADDVYIDELEFRGFSGSGSPTPPVAAFNGTPTSGTAPLTVAFTDASTNSPTSWSWTFGDGGTSTAQNPSHVYDTAGTYSVSLTVENADGSDTETKTGYITVTEPGSGNWVTITYDDFEDGWGSFVDGGGDCSRYTSGTYAHQGSCAGDIQDNSGTSSSFYHGSGHDVSAFVDLEVEFWYRPESMDRTGEDFWVQYYDGSAWRTVAVFDKGVDFENGNFYHEVVSIPAGTYNYPSDAKLRFMCDASGNKDDVYIDEIEFRGLTAGGSAEDPQTAAGKVVVPGVFALAANYPNPFNPITNIKFDLPRECAVTLTVYDVRGKVVDVLVRETLAAGTHVVTWDARRHPSGVYLYRIEAPGFSRTRKMVMLK